MDPSGTLKTTLRRRDFLPIAASAVLAAPLRADTPAAGTGQKSQSGNSGNGVILRQYLRPEHLEEDFAYLLEFCQITGCRELLLFTSSYEFDPSIISPEQLARYMARVRSLKAKAAAAHVKIYLNVLQTLGHVYLPEAIHKQYGIQRRVNIEGVPGEGGCPLDPAMRAYLKTIYRMYAEFGTELMFVDDDYRYIMQGIGCFCPLHLAEASKRVGRPVTLEEARRSVMSDAFEPDALKQVYWQVMNDAMVVLAREIESVVHEAAPDCRLGWMTGPMPFGSFGLDARKVTIAFSGGKHTPFLRPHGGMYSERAGKETGAILLWQSIARDLIGTDFGYYPEIENYHYSLFSKSAHMTFLQMLAQYFFGFENLAINLYFSCDICPDKAAHDPFAIMLRDKANIFETVRKTIGPNPVIEGVRIVDDLQRCWRSRSLENGQFPFYRTLLNSGFPVGFEGKPAFQVLTGDAVLAKNEGELKDILTRGVIIDARSLECLHHRGLTAEIGVSPGSLVSRDEIGSESFLDPEFSPAFHGKYYPLHAASRPGDILSLNVSNPQARVISDIVNHQKKRVTPAVVLTEAANGARFCVLAHTQPDARAFENPHRQEQLLRVLEWMGRRELPIKVLDTPFVVPYLVKTAAGRRFLLLINFASDTYDEVQLAGSALAGVRADSVSEVVPRRGAVRGSPSGNAVKIRKRLEPFDYVLLQLGQSQQQARPGAPGATAGTVA